MKLREELLKQFSPNGNEKCGVILTTGEVIELDNIHPSPEHNFCIAADHLTDQVYATWHTHPTGSPNLSVEDYKGFMLHPNLKHFIVANQQCWCFFVQDEMVVLANDNDQSAWTPKSSTPA